jgi:dTMP kinase
MDVRKFNLEIRMRGKFINIEGLDGCGKSTHARLLARWLRSRGRRVVVTDEPTDGQIGRFIKQVLTGRLKVPVSAEALLFAADRMQHVASLIGPSLRSGKIVINERYTMSSLAYQSARGLPIEWIKEINRNAPKPDLTILIDVPAEVSFDRIKKSRRLDEFERDLKLQQKVRQNYLRFAEAERAKVINGFRGVDEVQREMRSLVSVLL